MTKALDVSAQKWFLDKSKTNFKFKYQVNRKIVYQDLDCGSLIPKQALETGDFMLVMWSFLFSGDVLKLV